MSSNPESDGATPSPRGTVLVVDDEAYVRDSLVTVLERRGFTTRTAQSAEEALAKLEGLDVAIVDLRLPGASGDELLQRLQRQNASLPVVMLTGHGTVSSAVACMQQGAFDYLLKPADPNELVLVLERALAQSQTQRELDYLRSQSTDASVEGPLGGSPAWLEVMRLAHTVAPTDTTVLLQGESGTGKEELAKEIHRRSRRAKHAFVAVNCAAVPETLFESEFFGHRRGAFSGADRDRDGRFRVAHRGTLFLDEIDALSLASQAKVLRVIQDGTFERVGDSSPTQVDVRLLCATNHDLSKAVAEGRFREDLYYRVHVMPITLPPLRDRKGDVEVLARAFLAELAPRVGKQFDPLDADVIRLLDRHRWPGNVRELKNVIERGVLLEQSDRLTPECLPLELVRDDEPMEVRDADTIPDEDLHLRRGLARAERRLLREALRRAGGVRGRAAELLGVDPRNLAYYLKKYDLQEDGGGES